MSELEIDPEALSALSRTLGARFDPRRLVEGTLSGAHRSPRQGVSVDFAQHREYVPGDELRHLDWRAYARSERYYIKQFEEDRNLRAWLLLDLSGSMRFRGGGPRSKGAYGALVAAGLARLMLQQGDAVGLRAFHSEVCTNLPPSTGAAQLPRFLESLKGSRFGAKASVGDALWRLGEGLGARSVVFLLSDAFDFERSVAEVALRIQGGGHQVVLLQILDPHEISFPYQEMTLFEGLEDELPVTGDPRALASAYREELDRFCEALRLRCFEGGVGYCQLRTDEPLERAFLRLLGEVSG